MFLPFLRAMIMICLLLAMWQIYSDYLAAFSLDMRKNSQKSLFHFYESSASVQNNHAAGLEA